MHLLHFEWRSAGTRCKIMRVLVLAQDNRYVMHNSRSSLFLDVVRDPPGLSKLELMVQLYQHKYGFRTAHVGILLLADPHTE